ncbi:hypothetical protein HYQ46_004020 [Verticillium longisporum]|nr:hypothetical protein HYQ46_004020 [Verticillium longisporum]
MSMPAVDIPHAGGAGRDGGECLARTYVDGGESVVVDGLAKVGRRWLPAGLPARCRSVERWQVNYVRSLPKELAVALLGRALVGLRRGWARWPEERWTPTGHDVARAIWGW